MSSIDSLTEKEKIRRNNVNNRCSGMIGYIAGKQC